MNTSKNFKTGGGDRLVIGGEMALNGKIMQNGQEIQLATEQALSELEQRVQALENK